MANSLRETSKIEKRAKVNRDDITRAEAIRTFCKECKGFKVQDVNCCIVKGCSFWPYKKGKGKEATGIKEIDALSRSEAIRTQCKECMGGQVKLINVCSDEACPIWTFKRGEGKEHTDVQLRLTTKEYNS